MSTISVNTKTVSDLDEITELDGTGQDLIVETANGTKRMDAVNFYVHSVKLFGEDAAAAHNAIPRGKDLTDTYTVDEICEMISDETFDDLYVGDYFTTSITTEYGGTEEIDIMIGGFNYHLHSGSTETTTPHAICVLKDCFVTTAQMEESNTTENGYAGTVMHTTTLPVYATAIKSAIGDHVLTHPRSLTDGIDADNYSMAGSGLTGASNSTAWYDTELCLMSEMMILGAPNVSSSHRDNGDTYFQLPAFRYFPYLITAHQGKTGDRCNWWTSCVADSTRFAVISGAGGGGYGVAPSSYGVRPYFLLA